MTSQKSGVAILGIFVADLAFRAARMPGIGETIAGSGFKMGPGGKGSNQAVAAARAGAAVTVISKVGRDEFGAIAFTTWRNEGITARVMEAPRRIIRRCILGGTSRRRCPTSRHQSMEPNRFGIYCQREKCWPVSAPLQNLP